MSEPVRNRRPRLVPMIAAMMLIVVAAGGCTSAGAPAAASANAASAAPTLAPTPLPSTTPTAAAVASVSRTPAPATSSAGDGYDDGYGYGGTTSAAPTSSGATAGAALGMATISGVGTVLTGPDGKTLYTYKPDGAGASACDGGCAKAWPPVAAATTPALPAGVTGKLSLITRSDGSKQVAYNGRPLYGYAGDKGPGEASGQGLGGVWFVATP